MRTSRDQHEQNTDWLHKEYVIVSGNMPMLRSVVRNGFPMPKLFRMSCFLRLAMNLDCSHRLVVLNVSRIGTARKHSIAFSLHPFH